MSKRTSKIKFFPLIFILINCGSPLKEYYKAIKDLGFIPYTIPLAHSSTGTLIAGKPSRLSLIASPYSCFPRGTEGEQDQLRFFDATDLPNHYKEIIIDIKAHAKYLEALKNGTPSIDLTFKHNQVKNIKLEYGEATVEYIDSVRLANFYRDSIAADCKNYLYEVGFVIQALRVNELQFILYDHQGGEITLEVNNIKEYLDIGTDVSWNIKDEVKLIISTPKYIGYQLARFQEVEGGYSLERSNFVRHDRFRFEHVLFIPSRE